MGSSSIVIENNTSGYLSVQEATSTLSLMGIARVNLLNEQQIQFLISKIESYIDRWTGYRAAPTTYRNDLQSNEKNAILVDQYPVIRVLEVLRYYYYNPNLYYPPDQDSPPAYRCEAIYLAGNSIGVSIPEAWHRITWVAGYDPVPDAFKDAALALLEYCVEYGIGSNGRIVDPIYMLSSPTWDISSVSVPGGLSQTKTLGSGNLGSSGAGAKRGYGDGSIGDRILTNILAKYRRKIFFGVGR